MERQRRYKAYCKQHGYKLRNAVAPDNRNLPGMMVVDKYKLLFCRLAKVGHSNWLRLILQLNSNLTSEQAATAPLHSITTAHFFPELAFTKRFIPHYVRYRLTNYFKVIFVRHPLDRLLSAYEDKMGELSSSRNYYLKAFGAKIVSLCRKSANKDNNNKTFVNSAVTNVTFSEFLCYVSKAPVYDLDWHWQPYWTFCQLCESTWRFDFIGEYEYVADESNHVLDLLGIKHLRYPPHGYRTDRERRERFIRVYSAISSHLIDAIWRRFKVDFDVFGYKLYPNFWYET
jgi:chondroitin 4-sulfotransferase 11